LWRAQLPPFERFDVKTSLARGKSNVKMVSPGCDDISIEPPMREASSEAIARPSPLPDA
jgi:hypothetical protein